MLEVTSNLTLSDLVGGINAILTNMSEDSVGEVLKDICATKSLKRR